jgi:hypothetical protein
MPKTRLPNAVRLEFEPGGLVHSNLSGAAFTGECLWVAGDEACAVERLQRVRPRAEERLRLGKARSFALHELLDLPGAAADEADLEGMVVADGWLWVVGSHGLKRKNIKPDRDEADNAKRLARTSLDGNRRLLARLARQDGADGLPELVREAADGRVSARLRGDARHNELTELLAEDPHLGPFLKIPGKDNGFDIEGLALLGPDHLLLGLRGPVLRGWAVMLEVAVQPRGAELRLKPLGDSGTMLRKHFLPLEGLGLRDLHFCGDDLFALAGPTMVLNGDVRVFKWPNARQALLAPPDPALPTRLHTGVFEPGLSLPHGPGSDRAEAITRLSPELAGDQPAWLVLYDAPGPQRRIDDTTVFGDLLYRR